MTPDRDALWSLADMLRFYAEKFHAATNMIAGLVAFVNQVPAAADGTVLGPEITKIGKYLDDLHSIIEELDLGVSRQNIEFLRDRIKNNPTIDPDFRSALAMSYRLLNNELGLHLFLHVDFHDKKLFEPKKPLFGADVEEKFLSCIYEIQEAAKCLALGRSTAAAMHSIRCLEAGIRALSRSLGISDPTRASDRNWGKVLGTVKDEIDRRWPGASLRMFGDGEFFDNAYAGLAAMQNPWRNATMHLDQKYTLDEARNIFETVKGFMQKIASRMDEDGKPLA
jgi:hypothetical protein